MKGFFPAMALLIQAMSYGQSIFDVARSGDLQALQNMVKVNPDTVNSVNASGHTPLILAAYNDQVKMTEQLIKNGAHVNYTFSQGSAIHGAAFKGHLEIVKLLANNGAAVDEPDQNKSTPLIYATLFRHIEVVEYLLERGANPDYKDATGSSARSYAKSLNNEELLTLFKYK